jgi:hypothetical protein
LRRRAYSSACSVLWIEHGPTMTRTRSSRPDTMLAVEQRAEAIVFCELADETISWRRRAGWTRGSYYALCQRPTGEQAWLHVRQRHVGPGCSAEPRRGRQSREEASRCGLGRGQLSGIVRNRVQDGRRGIVRNLKDVCIVRPSIMSWSHE